MRTAQFGFFFMRRKKAESICPQLIVSAINDETDKTFKPKVHTLSPQHLLSNTESAVQFLPIQRKKATDKISVAKNFLLF
jgi:hypothetical protein